MNNMIYKYMYGLERLLYHVECKQEQMIQTHGMDKVINFIQC